MFARVACSTNASGSLAAGGRRNGSIAGRMRSTMARRLGDSWPCGWRSSSSVASIAPHCVCPRTTASRVSKRSAANSTLPTWDGATMLPATRMTKRSPNPCPKTSSAGTRESEQPRTMAKGCCPALGRPVGPATLSTKRRLPSRRRARASWAGIMVAVRSGGRTVYVKRSLLRRQQFGQAAVVKARQQQLRRDRAQKSGEHVPLCVPHVALRTKERVRRMTAGERRPPFEELVARAEREARRRHEDEQPAAGPERRRAQQDLADQDGRHEALDEVAEAVVIVT